MGRKLTQKEFEDGVRAVHGNDIDLSNAIYVKDSVGVEVKCNICGHVWNPTPNNLKHGKGCPKCKHRSRKYTLEEWKEKVYNVHGDRYDLSLITEYNSREQIMEVICHEKFPNGEEHGKFPIAANSLAKGRGCPYCASKVIADKVRKPFQKMIEDARTIHGDKFIYDESTYVDAKTEMRIICPIHGEFWQTPHKHINAREGCSLCNSSKLETEIRQLLTENNISFKESANKRIFTWLGKQHLDFYLPQYNIGIECQGKQHFKIVEYFGGEKEFKLIKERYERKKKLCEENGVKLLYFTHYEGIEEDNKETFKDKELLLEEILKLNKSCHVTTKNA